MRTLDMRGNRVGKQGIRAIAEALERSERVRHVYVHAGGKIEALGTGRWAVPRDVGGGVASVDGAAPMVTVETICVVDVRENSPAADAASALEALAKGHDGESAAGGDAGSKSLSSLPGAGGNGMSPIKGSKTATGGPGGKVKKKKSEMMVHKSRSEETIRAGEQAR